MRRHAFNLVSTLFFVAAMTTISALDIKCDFVYDDWVTIGNVYTCHVKDLVVKVPNENVTNIIGVHLDGKTNKDVIKINIASQQCEFLPRGFEKFFPNLQGLRVAQSGLVRLSQSDLSVFPELRSCDMFNNYLSSLDGDLFEKNTKVEYLYFGDNQISFVGHNILKPLKSLEKAIFQGNGCIDKNAESHGEVNSLQAEFNKKCSPKAHQHLSAGDYSLGPDDYDWDEHFFKEMKKLEMFIKMQELHETKQEELLVKEEKMIDSMKRSDGSSSSASFWAFTIVALFVMVPAVFYFARRFAKQKKMQSSDRAKILTSINDDIVEHV